MSHRGDGPWQIPGESLPLKTRWAAPEEKILRVDFWPLQSAYTHAYIEGGWREKKKEADTEKHRETVQCRNLTQPRWRDREQKTPGAMAGRPGCVLLVSGMGTPTTSL